MASPHLYVSGIRQEAPGEIKSAADCLYIQISNIELGLNEARTSPCMETHDCVYVKLLLHKHHQSLMTDMAWACPENATRCTLIWDQLHEASEQVEISKPSPSIYQLDSVQNEGEMFSYRALRSSLLSCSI